MDTCVKLKRSFLIVSERGTFCGNDRNRAVKGDSIIAPLVVADGVDIHKPINSTDERLIRIYFRGICPPSKETLLSRDRLSLDPSKFPVQWLLRSMLDELEEYNGTGSRSHIISVDCYDKHEKLYRQHTEIQLMKNATFCLIFPSEDGQATPMLLAAVLSGCIPVFIGPPFHALPFAEDVKYSRIAYFFNISIPRGYPSSGFIIDERDAYDPRPLTPPPPGELESNAGLKGFILKVINFRQIFDYLDGISLRSMCMK